jgi:hypothetical protein
LSVVTKLFGQYKPDAFVIKRLHPSRSSPRLEKLVNEIGNLARRKRLKIRRYSIQTLEAAFCPEAGAHKRRLAEIMAMMHPALHYDLDKELQNKHPYRVRMFEAVALGTICHQQLERKNN